MFEIFAKSVKNHKEAIAVILSNKEKLTYAEVDAYVDLWAKYLVFLKIKQGDRVAVLTKHEDLHVFIHLALDKINATVVPLDLEIPSAQLKLDIKTLDLKKILLDEHLLNDSIPAHLSVALKTSGMLPQNTSEFSDMILPEIKRDNDIPNYIVASSGVTGNKKWIPIGAEGLKYWAKIETSLLKLSTKDNVLCTRSPAYDARISEYVRSFAAGSTLVLMSMESRRDIQSIMHQCEEAKITCLILIASQLTLLNQEAIIKHFSRVGLIHLMVTGDACTISLKQLCEQYGIQLWNCYGPTEATFGMSILCVNNLALLDEGRAVVPIGFPHSDDVKCHLIDECLYIESPFLSKGYVNNPELSEKNFPTLLINHQKIRVFNTENRFSIKDNLLIFKGRINSEDAHCKVSGVKVEPFAIQQCLEQFPKVLQVYVVIKPWLDNNKPFAYMVIQDEFSKQDFMDYLKKWLRKEEIPIIIVLPDFPRLIPSQKIDRRQLIERVDHPDEFFFNNPIKLDKFDNKFAVLSEIWCESLGINNSHDEQEFMFLGGDSFQLTQLCLRIQKELDPDFSYQQVMSLTTLTFGNLKALLCDKNKVAPNMAIIKLLGNCYRDKLNYFFLPPLLGEGYFTYAELSKIFISKHEFNVYGLCDPSIYDSSLIPKTLEEAVSRYINAIKSIQPKGPYYLLGFSYGGTLAYYVAKELFSQHEEVRSLQLIDAFPPALYQKLPSKVHFKLLEELISFIIQTLNIRFYDEGLDKIDLSKFAEFNSMDQINKSFDLLIGLVKKPHSKSLLMLARQHLLLMLTSEATLKLPIWVNLYLSSPNQTYLNVIYQIPEIIEQSTKCQYYYWNQYFQEVNLCGIRVEEKHLDLLKSQQFGNSIHNFWQRAHDPLFNFHYDDFGLDPYYTLEKINQQKVICHVYSLHLIQLKAYREKFSAWEDVTNISSFSIYERVGEKYVQKDRICATRYGLSFEFSKEKIKDVHNFFANKKISQYVPLSLTKKPKGYYIDQKSSQPSFIKLDIYWCRAYLMSLHFTLYSDIVPIVKKILKKMKLKHDDFSVPSKYSFNYTYNIGDNRITNNFTIIKFVSAQLNEFITFLLPYIESSEFSHNLKNVP